MSSLCAFIHYGKAREFPLYVKIYVNELANHFDEVALLYNEREIQCNVFLFHANVQLVPLKNEGYDFGMFYKYFTAIDTCLYSQIAFINDSNVLFNDLNSIFSWAKTNDYDFWGLVDSHEKPWFSTHKSNLHIQSHFLIFNQKAIEGVKKYMATLDINIFINEKDKKSVRRMVIDKWEIGLSRYLFGLGLKGGSYIESRYFLSQKELIKPVNSTHVYYKELIQSGIPLIKKKIILQKSLKSCFPAVSGWEKLIYKHGNKDWDLKGIVNGMKLVKSGKHFL